MTINWRTATQTDIPSICTTFARSFWQDPVVRWLFPDDDQFRDGTVMKDFLRRNVAHGTTLVTPDVAAYAMWIPPGRPEVEIEPTSTELPPPELMQKFVALVSAVDTHTPQEHHWYLQMVGTHPDWQRRGLGSQLINEGLSWARRDGLPAYLETETIDNVGYYRHLGFEVRSQWVVDAGGPQMWGMWHPCQ